MTEPPPGFRIYVILWCGQFCSSVGTFLADFALGVYVYQRTESVTTLGLVYALPIIPLIIISPVAGTLVDRWGTKWSLLVSNVGSMIIASILAALLIGDNFAVWQVYLVVGTSSALLALQLPAFETSVRLLVPSRQIGRANGMRLFANAASQVLAPVLGGVLLIAIGIQGIVLINCVSYGIAVLTLLVISIPQTRSSRTSTAGAVTTVLTDFKEVWGYLVARPGSLALMVYLGVISLFIGFVEVLINPLVLAFASADALGAVLSTGGFGLLVGSLAMGVWGGPRRRIRGVLLSSLLLAAAIVVGSLRPNVPLIAVAAFVFLGCSAIIVGSSQNIWLTKIDPPLLGRAMAVKNTIIFGLQFVGFILAGVTADQVFTPLVGEDRVHSHTLARLIGDGPGRGFALLLMVMGVLIALLALVASRYPRLRRVESELPDLADEPGTDGEPQPAPAHPQTARG